MTESTKTYGCVVYRSLPGHIRVKSRSVFVRQDGDKYLSYELVTTKPDPGDRYVRGRFVQYNGTVYYITLNHRVYETNIEPGRTVRFSPNVGYMILDEFQAVPVMMRKLDKVEWLFL